MKVAISITSNSCCISFCAEDVVYNEREVLDLIARKALDICKTLTLKQNNEEQTKEKGTAQCQE